MQVMDSILQALTNSGVRDKGGKAVQNVQQILGQLLSAGQQIPQNIGNAMVPEVQAWTQPPTTVGGLSLPQQYDALIRQPNEPAYSQYLANPNSTTLGQLVNPISAPITFSSLSGDSGGSASTPYYEIEDERGYINQRNPSYEGWDKDIWNAQPPYMLSDLDLARMYQQAIIADARNSFKGYWNPGQNRNKFMELYNSTSKYAQATYSQGGFSSYNGQGPWPNFNGGNVPWNVKVP